MTLMILTGLSIFKEHTIPCVMLAVITISTLTLACRSQVQAAPVITVGTISLLPDTANQTVAIPITGTELTLSA